LRNGEIINTRAEIENSSAIVAIVVVVVVVVVVVALNCGAPVSRLTELDTGMHLGGVR
jgi:hypothetical protein